MSDLISRQAAIDEIIDSFECGDYLQETLRRLEDLPTVQPEQWTPCSERLPDMYRAYYLVSLADKKEVDIAYFTEYGTWETFRNDDVIAWMTLPEPYRKDGEADG